MGGRTNETVILQLNFEEIRALRSGGRSLLEGVVEPLSPVVAPPESRARVEALRIENHRATDDHLEGKRVERGERVDVSGSEGLGRVVRPGSAALTPAGVHPRVRRDRRSPDRDEPRRRVPAAFQSLT